MVPQWIIEQKRDGRVLSEQEIGFFINGYVGGGIPDYQMSALAMAVFFRGMSVDETVALTRAMWRSGLTIDTSSLQSPRIDKHSTGGVGDKISLVLAPLAACCGVAVPMIAGRGLGITGGTLDKLESIPGYRTGLSESEFIHVLETCGCSMIGQTRDIVPADRKLYALRDVTGTVPSVPLIVSSILSKKLAEGIDGLVMDVKWGAGAFMKTKQDAETLARALVEVGRRMGLRVAALITDMNQPLGRAVGNALEIVEVVETLKGNGPADIVELTLALCARMLMLADIAPDLETAHKSAQTMLRSGEAFDRFKEMIRQHGGDTEVLERPDRLCTAGIKEQVRSSRRACVRSLNAEAIGRACLVLGSGRTKVDDEIDHAVGVSGLKKVGEWAEPGEPVATVHASGPDQLASAFPLVRGAFEWSDAPVTAPQLICEEL